MTRTAYDLAMGKVAACLVATIVLTSCGSGSHAAPGPKRVAFVGDSNVLLATGALALAMFNRNDDWPLDIDAKVGAGIHNPAGYWKAPLDDLARRGKPDVYVTDLGINDTGTVGTADGLGYAAYGHKIDDLMRLFGKHPVLWTNLPCKIEPKARLTGCDAVDAALDQAQSRHPNLTVLDWAAIANSHPQWMATFVGGVHYKPAGYVAWSELVVEALEPRLKT